MKKQLIRGAIMMVSIMTGVISSTAASLVVGSFADGSLSYYNPYNGVQGSINNDGVVWDGGSVAGDTIGVCAYGDSIYTFGMVTGGANAGQYRVNYIDLSGVGYDVSGDDIVASNPGNRNILTNLVSATLVDFAYDGTDFWFLAADGRLYKNSSTTAILNFSDFQPDHTYKSLSLWGTGGLVTSATGSTTSGVVLGYDGSSVSWLHSYQDAAALGITLASGHPDTSIVSVVRIDNLVYNYDPSEIYLGNLGYRGPPALGCALGFSGGVLGAFTVDNAGNLAFNGLTVGAFAGTLGIVAAEVSDPPPDPFPWIGNITDSNLIPNGELDTLENENPATPGTWNVLGTFGDWEGVTNRTASLISWSPYYADPNSPTTLVAAVGTPHVIDGIGELDGTSYLDTLIDGNSLVLNSVMDYRNGMKQENILSGVTLDSLATYEFKIDISIPAWNTLDVATFTAALTVGSGADVTNTTTAVPGSLLATNVNSIGSEPQVRMVSGADLIVAQSSGQVNVMLDHVNATSIPGFPGSVDPGDVSNIALLSQVMIDTVSLAEVLTPVEGDVTRDGMVTSADVDLANSYLDGSIDVGDSAVDRQSILIVSGMTSNEALTYLNLTDFDLTGNDFFDADDIASLEALVVAPNLYLNENGGVLGFGWLGNEAKQYDLLSKTSLNNGSVWTVYNDGVSTYENIAGASTNMISGVLPNGLVNFFKLLEKDGSTSYITVLDSGFENGTVSGNWGAVNPVWNPAMPSAYQVNNGDHIDAEEGSWSVLLENTGTITQNLGTTVNAGDTLTLIFSGGRAKVGSTTENGGVFNATIIVDTTDYPMGTSVDTTGLMNNTWQSYTNTAIISNSGNLSVRFDPVSGQAWLDNVTGVKRVEP